MTTIKENCIKPPPPPPPPEKKTAAPKTTAAPKFVQADRFSPVASRLKFDKLTTVAFETAAAAGPNMYTETIKQLYRDLLGREADGEGLSQFEAMAARMAVDGSSDQEIKDGIANIIMQSPEYVQLHAPPPPGLNSWNVPYISQLNPTGAAAAGYQNPWDNCGPASMAMVAKAMGYGTDVSDAELIMRFRESGGTRATGQTGVYNITDIAKQAGLTSQVKGPGANVAWVEEQLKAGKLVLANGDYYEMEPHQNAAKSSGHYVVVTGMDANGNFLVNDPAGAQQLAVSRADLARFIAGNPNGGFQISIGKP